MKNHSCLNILLDRVCMTYPLGPSKLTGPSNLLAPIRPIREITEMSVSNSTTGTGLTSSSDPVTPTS